MNSFVWLFRFAHRIKFDTESERFDEIPIQSLCFTLVCRRINVTDMTIDNKTTVCRIQHSCPCKVKLRTRWKRKFIIKRTDS